MALGHTLTTLELARIVAQAARAASSDETAAVAVIDTLHEQASWFCHMGIDTDPDVPYSQWLDEQPSLLDLVPPPGDRCGTLAETAWRDRRGGGGHRGGGQQGGSMQRGDPASAGGIPVTNAKLGGVCPAD